MNNYPGISLNDASIFLQEFREEGYIKKEEDIKEKTVGSFENELQYEKLSNAINQIVELADSLGECNNKTRPEFTREASEIIHKDGEIDEGWARDPNFWRWLTFANSSAGAIAVTWRYKTLKTPQVRDVYYGLGSINESLLYSLWKKSDMYYSEKQGYDLVGAIPDVDFFVSHMLRVEWACCKNLSRAFAKLVKEYKIPRGERKDKSKPAGFRDFAVELQRRFPTTTYEVMDEEEAMKFLKSVWESRKIW